MSFHVHVTSFHRHFISCYHHFLTTTVVVAQVQQIQQSGVCHSTVISCHFTVISHHFAVISLSFHNISLSVPVISRHFTVSSCEHDGGGLSPTERSEVWIRVPARRRRFNKWAAGLYDGPTWPGIAYLTS
jgi:hypothetical protein